MAESILPIAEMLIKLVLKEAAFLHGVKEEVESLAEKLKDIGYTLSKFDVMIDKEEEFDKWVGQLRDLAFKAEDVIEVFVNNATPYDGCDVFLLIMGCFCQIITLHKLKDEINNINMKLEKLPRGSSLVTVLGSKDGETSIPHHQEEDQPASSRWDEDDDIVGFQEEANKLALSLTEEESGAKVVVVSIWAQAGAGKTALARNIYKRSDVKSQFDCVAWVSVSQDCKVKDVWQAILKQVKKLKENQEKELQLKKNVELRDMVFHYLQGKNYLVVLDDLWKQEDWEIISKAFPKSPKKKCRVLITTRIKEVACGADPLADPKNLRALNEVQSLELFLKKVYQCSSDRIPSLSRGMKDLAREMVAKCEGLPIAIVLLGGFLSVKSKDIFEWTNMLEKVHSNLAESRILRKVFALSYNELPYFLKPCFLYFGLFPEDSVIECDKLIRLWVAEGFLKQRDNQTMEDVGRDFLMELIQRSMIQVVECKSNGAPQTCRTHHIVRSLAIREAKNAKFSRISMERHQLGSVEGSRRIALHSKDVVEIHMGTSSSSFPFQSNSLLTSSRIGPSVVIEEAENDDFVGCQKNKDQLASLLTQEEPLGRLAAVSIVGIRGIGKTTLAHKVYDQNDVKFHFDCRAWVCVSYNDYVVNDILKTILQQVKPLTDAESKLEDEEELLSMLHNHLKSQSRYLIVLDNVRRQEDWDVIEKVFPKPVDRQKCRVLVTTRDSSIAHYIDPSGISLEPHVLKEEESLTLFQQTIFKYSKDEIPEQMMDIARELVKLCDGLPLGIVVLGRLLSAKTKDVSVWLDVLELLRAQGNINRSLALYTKDNELTHEGSSTSTATTNPSPPPKTFSLTQDILSFFDPFNFPNHVYSLMCFSKNPREFPPFDQQFPLLRVLDLEGAKNIIEVPNEIMNLNLLKYLNLRGTRVELIPSWIGNLRNLLTLDAPGSKIPIDILKLNQLRHLFAHSFSATQNMCCPDSSSSSSSVSLCIDVLEHLETLELDDVGGHWKISGLYKLTYLRVLRLRRGGDCSLLRAIACLKRLKVFSLTQAVASSSPVHLQSLSRHKDLYEMVVEGIFTEANDLQLPPFLTYLWLENSNWVDPFFPDLQKLGLLKKLCLRLSLSKGKSDDPITFSAGGFPKLEYLYIRVDFVLQNWIVEEGALPSLRLLHIEGNYMLGELPAGLRHINTLKELIITKGYDVRNSLMYGGKEWEKVRDLNPSIKYLDESSMRP
ncbi:probable disease resistance RPP8-like protein 2 [Macadamia integrifolia]|uniref:probable disease resistance RPP8-like protein 2 n=1 Tax=Macadamia integrifolia TaxID=60698 RepID=UPI001C4EAD7C|nr:probable disease resistance RPP8-like protein 2 [Macadamia integrifolia]